jgi:hypothetical protein
MSTTTATPESAAHIISTLLVTIPERFPNARCWRRNVGAARLTTARFVRFGIPGEPDIDGIINICGVGVRFGIEVKGPGDRLSQKQRNFGSMITNHGGIWLVAYSVDEALADFTLYTQSIAKRITA